MAEVGNHAYQIGGIKVEFPYKAYGPQLAYMGKIISTLERAYRDPQSHSNALLESPTGSGKSLALLCAALAWQEHRKNVFATQPAVISQFGPATLVGGGFIPEDPTPEPEDKKKLMKKTKPPTIFFATRTHSQISQIVHELRKTSYRVPMTILAARKHYCTNKHVSKKANIDEECNILLKDPHKACPEFKNVHKLKCHTSLQKGGTHEIHDIEDLVNIGHRVKGCAYFAARAMAADARIVFCPYSYILHPIFRKAMEIDIRGAVIIFDEAHNIEDLAREAGSINLDTNTLEELEQLSSHSEDQSGIYRPLLELIEEMLIWVRQSESRLLKVEYEQYCSCWTGMSAIEELQAFGMSLRSFPVLFDCAVKAAGAASNPDPEKPHLSGRAASAVEGLFTVLNLMLSKPERMHDYHIAIQKQFKRDSESGVQGWIYSVNFWCMNPAVVFDEIAATSQSVILTSGTLSPMGSFASELGAAFEITMEAPHIIDMEKQVFVGALSVGPGNVVINASYKHSNGVNFQDALGLALERICGVVPDGALVFFPSYSLLERLRNRWKATGQWDRIVKSKELFVEPRGATEKFDYILKGYYRAIQKNSKKKKKPLRKSHKQNSSSNSTQNGAAFLAVCRGKVSEGINFSDENARLVVVVGIPFPNAKDMQVNLKKQYNDKYRALKNLMSGDEWYCFQAFRAINQAVGRCIRHRNDYGAILLLDERFDNSRYLGYMSKWLRNSVSSFDAFGDILGELKRFFSKHEIKVENVIQPLTQKNDTKNIPAISDFFCSSYVKEGEKEEGKEEVKEEGKEEVKEEVKEEEEEEEEEGEEVKEEEEEVKEEEVKEKEEEVKEKVKEEEEEEVKEEEEEGGEEEEGKGKEKEEEVCGGVATESTAEIVEEGANIGTREDEEYVSDSGTEDEATCTASVRSTISSRVGFRKAKCVLSCGRCRKSIVKYSRHKMEYSSCSGEYSGGVECEVGELQKSYLVSMSSSGKERVEVYVVGECELLLEGDEEKEEESSSRSSSSSVWVRRDGCVFKPMRCVWCSKEGIFAGAERIFVGALIVAADPLNTWLAGKVALLKELVNASCVKEEEEYDGVVTPCLSNAKRPNFNVTPPNTARLKFLKTGSSN